MSTDYISTYTKDWVYGIFCHMTDAEFSKELAVICAARDLYLSGDNDLVNSFVLEYLDQVRDIALDSLITRYLRENMPSDVMHGLRVI